MPRRRPKDLRTGRRPRRVRSPAAVAAADWIAIRVLQSRPALLRGTHVVIEIDGVPLLNTFHDGLSHVVGVHPDSFFAPGSAVLPIGEERAFMAVGDPIDCYPECCGVGAWVWRDGDRIHWQLIGDRWNRHLLTVDLEFDREEYLFTIEWARDAWIARSEGRAAGDRLGRR